MATATATRPTVTTTTAPARPVATTAAAPVRSINWPRVLMVAGVAYVVLHYLKRHRS